MEEGGRGQEDPKTEKEREADDLILGGQGSTNREGGER